MKWKACCKYILVLYLVCLVGMNANSTRNSMDGFVIRDILGKLSFGNGYHVGLGKIFADIFRFDSLPRYTVSRRGGLMWTRKGFPEFNLSRVESGVSKENAEKVTEWNGGLLSSGIVAFSGLFISIGILHIGLTVGCIVQVPPLLRLRRVNDETKLKSDPRGWVKHQERKSSCSKCSRGWLACHSCTLILFFALWFLFAWQSALSLSSLLDHCDQSIHIVDSGVSNFADEARNGFQESERLIGNEFLRVNASLVEKLPPNSELENLRMCPMSLVNSLPSLNFLRDFVEQVTNTLDSLPSIEGLQDRAINIEIMIETVLDEIAFVDSFMNETIFEMSSMVPQFEGLEAELNRYNDVLQTFPKIEEIETVLDGFSGWEDIFTNRFTGEANHLENDGTFIGIWQSRITTSLMTVNPSNVHIGGVLFNELWEIVNLMIDAKLNELITTLEGLKNGKIELHSDENINDVVSLLDERVNGLNLTGITESIFKLDSYVVRLKTMMEELEKDVMNMSKSISQLPSFETLVDEIAKLGPALNEHLCMEPVLEELRKYNQSIFTFDNRLNELYRVYENAVSKIESLELKIQVQAELEKIDIAQKKSVPILNQELEKFNFPDIFQTFPNTAKMYADISALAQDFSISLSDFNFEEFKNRIDAFTDSMNSIPDLDPFLSSYVAINDSIKSIVSNFHNGNNEPLLFIDTTSKILLNEQPDQNEVCPSACRERILNDPLVGDGNGPNNQYFYQYSHGFCAILGATKWCQFRDDVLGRPDTTAIVNSLNTIAMTLENAPSFPDLATKTNELQNTIKRFQELQPILNNLRISTVELSGITPNFTIFRQQMDIFQHDMGKVNLQIVDKSIEESEFVYGQLQDREPYEMFAKVQETINSLNFGSLKEVYTSIHNSILGRLKILEDDKDLVFSEGIDERRSFVLVMDGIRLFLTFFWLLLMFPLVSFGLGVSVLCHRRTKFLMCLTCYFLFGAVINWFGVFLVIPINTALRDACPSISDNMWSVVMGFVPHSNYSDNLQPISSDNLQINELFSNLNATSSYSANFSFSIQDLYQSYKHCHTKNIFEMMNHEFSNINSNLTVLIPQFVLQLQFPENVRLQGEMLAELDRIKDVVNLGIDQSIQRDFDIFSCTKYGDIHDSFYHSLCENGLNTSASFGGTSTIFGILNSIIGCIYFFIYLCLEHTRVWTPTYEQIRKKDSARFNRIVDKILNQLVNLHRLRNYKKENEIEVFSKGDSADIISDTDLDSDTMDTYELNPPTVVLQNDLEFEDVSVIPSEKLEFEDISVLD